MPLALLPDWLTADGLFQLLGPWTLVGFAAIIFIECGLFIGLFFPGDSLLFLAGMLVASGAISQPLWLVITVLYVAAVAGNILGYHIGHVAGPRLFSNTESRWLRPEYVERTHAFFERYGNRAIVLARFVPIVRSLITAVAGIARMDRGKFYFYSAIGAIFWVIGIVLLGSALGEFTFVKDNLEFILLAFVVVSTIPILTELRKYRREGR